MLGLECSARSWLLFSLGRSSGVRPYHLLLLDLQPLGGIGFQPARLIALSPGPGAKAEDLARGPHQAKYSMPLAQLFYLYLCFMF